MVECVPAKRLRQADIFERSLPRRTQRELRILRWTERNRGNAAQALDFQSVEMQLGHCAVMVFGTWTPGGELGRRTLGAPPLQGLHGMVGKHAIMMAHGADDAETPA